MRETGAENQYLTPVNISMVLINAVVYIVLEIMGDTTNALFMLAHGAMYPAAVLEGGQYYRLLTSSFIHFGLPHLINNMILLICLGSYVERVYGKVRYLILYLVCAAGSSWISMLHMLDTGDQAVSGGASGVVFGIIGALLFLIVKNKGRLENLPWKRFLIMILLALYFGFASAGVDNAAHIGGLATGFVTGAVYFLLEKMYYLLRRHE